MNANIRYANPKVINPTTNIISAHFQSPLISAGKKPKNNVVQENPTGASLSTPDLLLNVIVAKAIQEPNIIKFLGKVILSKNKICL